MQAQLSSRLPPVPVPRAASLYKLVLVGASAGVLGTLVMDLFGVALIVLMGGMPTLSFVIIGDAAAAGAARVGIALAGGFALGAVLHYLIGLALGVLLAGIVTRWQVLALDSRRKGLAVGILFVELMSLPMLAAAAVLLEMNTALTLQWFGMSFVMHLVYGAVLGWVLWFGLHPVRGAEVGTR